MTTPANDPLDDAIKNIDKKIEEKFKSDDEKFDRLAQNITAEVRSIVQPKEEPKKKWLEDDDDDTSYITKADLKKVVRDVVTEVKSETKTVAESIFEEKTTKMNRDMQVFIDFPEADKHNKKHFNPKFLTEVQNEMNARVARGKHPDDADLMYDSAQAVWNRWVRQGRTLPEHLVKRQNEKDNAGDDNFDMGDGQNRQASGPNERQLAMARRFGLNEEKFKQRFENKRKNG